MDATTDVVIVGGGIIGCAIAYYLSKSQISVTVVERGEIGGQASGAAAGLLAPLGPLSGPGPLADFLLAGFAFLPSVIQALEAETGLDLDYRQTGALRIVRNPKRVVYLKKRWEAWKLLLQYPQNGLRKDARNASQQPASHPEQGYQSKL